MIHYLAGSPALAMLERIGDRAKANHFLFTFAGSEARKCAEHFCTQPQRRLFIDSGAFTVWTKGAAVDLGNYIDFCKKVIGKAKCPVVFAALDVIPGRKGGPKPTEGEIERACDQGWDNYQTMRQEGIPCLMTYHQFEHARYLGRIADHGDYIAIATRKSENTKSKLEWLESVFNYLQGKNRSANAVKKIHGLGISSSDWMMQFPFYSVDNTAWLQSFRSHSRAQPTHGGLKTKYMTLEKWEQRARADGIPTTYLRQMLGYAVRGEASDPDGHSGHYWLMYLAMDCAVEKERLITDFWRKKGLVWEDQEQDAVLVGR